MYAILWLRQQPSMPGGLLPSRYSTAEEAQEALLQVAAGLADEGVGLVVVELPHPTRTETPSLLGLANPATTPAARVPARTETAASARKRLRNTR